MQMIHFEANRIHDQVVSVALLTTTIDVGLNFNHHLYPPSPQVRDRPAGRGMRDVYGHAGCAG